MAAMALGVVYTTIGVPLLWAGEIAQLPTLDGARHPIYNWAELAFGFPISEGSNAEIHAMVLRVFLNGMFWGVCIATPPVVGRQLLRR